MVSGTKAFRQGELLLPNSCRTVASIAQQNHSRKSPQSALNHTGSLCNNHLETVWFLLAEPCAVHLQSAALSAGGTCTGLWGRGTCGADTGAGNGGTCCFAELGSLPLGESAPTVHLPSGLGAGWAGDRSCRGSWPDLSQRSFS